MTPDQEAGIRTAYAEYMHALALLGRVHAILGGIDEVCHALRLPVDPPLTGIVSERITLLGDFTQVADRAELMRRKFPHLISHQVQTAQRAAG